MSTQQQTCEKHHPESCAISELAIWQRYLPAPWISRVFDAMGLVFIATGIVLFFISWMTEETKFYIALCVSFVVSGLLYTAAGELLRSSAESARNTAKLVALKEIEMAEKKNN